MSVDGVTRIFDGNGWNERAGVGSLTSKPDIRQMVLHDYIHRFDRG